jgi:hypothetical protein
MANGIRDTESANIARCPSCGSPSVQIVKKGYSAGKGCCGFLTCGPLGFLCGQTGANKIEKVCLVCNYKWR